MTKSIEDWENEGGAVSEDDPGSLHGTEIQVEWAVRIRRKVDKEFDQVAAAFRSVAERQTGDKRTNTEALISILRGQANRGDEYQPSRVLHSLLARDYRSSQADDPSRPALSGDQEQTGSATTLENVEEASMLGAGPLRCGGSTGTKAAVIVAHPDDEVLRAGRRHTYAFNPLVGGTFSPSLPA